MHAIDEYVDLLLTPAEIPARPAAAAEAPSPVRAALPGPEAPVGSPPAVPAAPAMPISAPRRREASGDLPAAPAGPDAPGSAGTTAAPAAALARWLRLRCGDQAYALELLKIREVVLPSPLLPLRGAAASVRGVMNLRGQVVPVIDLGLQFTGKPSGTTPATRIIVLEERNEVLGLQVSAVEDIVLLDEAGVENPRTSRLAPVGDQRIRGIARLGGRVMLLLDAARLIATPLH